MKNRYLLFSLVAVAAIIVGYLLSNTTKPVAPAGGDAAGEQDTVETTDGTAQATSGKTKSSAKDPYAGRDPATIIRPAVEVAPEPEDVPEDPPTPEEKAVIDWDNLVDRYEEPLQTPPTPAQRAAFYNAFKKLHEDNQQESIARATNLLPDENISLLYDILFDTSLDETILDAVFSDVLNRPEEIKEPIIDIIAKDKKHPLFTEAAHIKNVTAPDPE